ncbi:phosphoenolpyruvate-protein phosphotransferase [Herbaspirillum rubrisubalbicans]|uniref:Phosphoenolpyruvate-protein phosphotransferase n=2 Tax=Herbaspirillum rubrisubalbicans TaxID=80842 RepID=A0AAD0XEG0_9BURK|nr:phosphoenolpyruvate--protein phosphotransferase [Herbaspirillum rubrisubalbicans]ALU87337.1 phosphoenolpyruvate-protein phosphotransferase [Herbaspirillum rubrisubalbicans M1]AYR22387.1 phosphoenolpyruvate--protein phosphotransferase [Herbaspirillum rubrisubalbicans]QJP98800.1 phosphoenolpyruvate--protein phosphotransferase [Herbaspirillum rubrisubalbicans Os34]RAM61287.1 phosphoenolpyruvate-protein phosphotransferase [Herbaspirillum rubrisubalbicans]RAN46647.1 phosphoenolpyruvate-protein p
MASFSLHGIAVSQGIAIGRAHLMAPAALDVKHYLIAAPQVEAEVARLKSAVKAVHQELHTIRTELPKDAPPELGAFIDVHSLILSDPLLAEVPQDIIRHRYYNAEWALVTQIEELSAQFDDIEDPYLRERKADIQQVGERILKVLTGSAGHLPPTGEAAANIIVVAHDISPADMLQFRESAFAGFVTDLGGPNSHTAIVARSLAIPAAVGMHNASVLVKHDDVLIIDGDAGVVIVDPSPLVLAQYRARQERLLRERKKLSRLKKTPAITQDGEPITLLANIELPNDAAPAFEAGAMGIGLFRSEFLFMGRAGHLEKFPSEDEQFESYKQAVIAMKGRVVTIRTLDVGADKPLDADEETALNPALGLRAIRYCLSEPQMFLTQLRAILRASAYGPIKLLVPMMAHAFEIDQTLSMIEQAKQQLRDRKQKFDEDIPIGAMIEIPAAALALPLFIKRLDFLSIGTNDLIQYTLAIDRVDHEVAHLYDPLHPAVLFLLSTVISQGRKAGIPVSVCGEMAGDLKWTRLLLGMGLLEFSMHPSQILSVKNEILNSDLRLLEPQVKKVLRATEPAAINAAMAQLQALQAEAVELDTKIAARRR